MFKIFPKFGLFSALKEARHAPFCQLIGTELNKPTQNGLADTRARARKKRRDALLPRDIADRLEIAPLCETSALASTFTATFTITFISTTASLRPLLLHHDSVPHDVEGRRHGLGQRGAHGT
eukprot:CAMPEP_0205921892 /NCGR_PEP_ID=MMETSP1325-20131115/13596_1 /ASSEMBLY_ACC=CAM_ASM_000708 /TAXON_ID=236786 /ORGANISM="Florenciella sp., Strain RCC1007" /LENGTH=121 /DNA_ID=CAMNT_0053289813 /DNA_START=64 /DNA_END=429 /DNA_ORIENTATION=+